jgi:uncharacterized protein (DUF433 family)
MKNEKLLTRIALDPEVMAGKPVIRGTRVPVDLLIRLVAEGLSFEEILQDYPQLSREDIQAALLYGAEVVHDEEVFPLAVGKDPEVLDR